VTGAAALVVARAPADPAALPGLLPTLGPERCAALQALLIRRAAAWAAAVAPGAARLALLSRAAVEGAAGAAAAAEGAGGAAATGSAAGAAAVEGAAGAADAAAGAAGAAAAAGGAASAAHAAAADRDAVAAVLPGGVALVAARDLEDALGQAGGGPLLVAGTGCARLGVAHAAAALDDLEAGCDFVFGATLDGGWYLAGLRAARPELLSLAALRSGGIGAMLRRAEELGAEVGMLRHERVLATPGDAAALLADPLLDGELRAALSA
jgi:glycosyltransferase A (GT-A) superfamily protein (DUF2064 family)